MKNSIIITSIAVLLGIFTACKSDTTQSETNKTFEKASYSYDKSNSVMEFVAYKFESKAPVKGTFGKINITSVSEAETPLALAESMGFTIPVSSIITQDVSRDAKIIEFFFGVMTTTELTGHFTELNEDGTAKLEITMHGITDVIEGTYKLKDTHFSFQATMDLAKWNAAEAIKVLNENCNGNHTENGITKVWNDVDLSFTTDFVKTTNL